jgi:hypothetical protein
VARQAQRPPRQPERDDLDPDIDIPVLAFSEEDALEQAGFERFMVAPARWFFPLLLLQALHLRVETSSSCCASATWRYRNLEWALFALHHVIGLGLVFWALPFGTASPSCWSSRRCSASTSPRCSRRTTRACC